jgi:hypothetical protein
MAKELKSLLNLNYLDLTNKTHKVGKYDLPSVKCPAIYDIDYIALYKELRNYQKTPKTVISFYQFDKEFDGINGLSNAIWYNDKRRLEFFKRRFSNCRYFIAPDYSQCGDIENAENIHRIFRARVISLWLTLNLGAIVIPNITYSNKKSFEYMLDGLEECQTVAFSTKGIMKKSSEKDLLIAAIAKTVDTLNLKSIIVYTVSIDKETVLKLFAYAINRNIEIIIPDNLLQKRNIERSDNLYGKI